MNRNHMEAAAEQVRTLHRVCSYEYAIIAYREFVTLFKRFNPRFNEDKFRKASFGEAIDNGSDV